MRITPSLLHKIARDTVSQRTRLDHSILAVYLSGSLVSGDPLLGGTTDIDLFFIHDDLTSPTREIERLTDEVHLDIAHQARDTYHQTRELRLHPWLGEGIINCKVMYDPQHFLDFTQASVRAQFNQPEIRLQRVQSQAEHARQIWLSLHDLKVEPGLAQVEQYLRAVGHAANAVACLSGGPLTERRFLLQYPGRAAAVGRDGLYPGLVGLLGGAQLEGEALGSMLAAWEEAYRAIPQDEAPARLHPVRFEYYQRAFKSMLGSKQPQDVLWPLLRTWTSVVECLPDDDDQSQDWRQVTQELGLLGPGFSERVAAMDAYLDNVEELLDEWAIARGIEPGTL
jgi:hypothetical protein